eukprot:gb/GFBE01076990.1/.p1 GENE.gb/GFBE01076990.1/~~gb/GFBE01076990.1/.p1  ORF type:complete len:357 (+),score=65.78 gb/GFBE01076990.1/:1-1071(+)
MASFPAPTPPLVLRNGTGRVLLVAPHALTELEAAKPFLNSQSEIQAQLAEEVAEWHDDGSGEAFEEAARRLGAPGLRPVIPRGLMDLNRGWKGRAEAKETLFGKGALSSWASEHLQPGAREALEGWYRGAIGMIQDASKDRKGFVEIHSYGDLGSTYDKEAGGRPVRRSEAALVLSTPWATQYPVGLARLLPGDLRGTPKALERSMDQALERNGFRLGPSPYPATGPWALSMRFLASRWFAWLADTGRLPAATAAHLATLAWTDEQDEEAEAVAKGEREESDRLLGVRKLALDMGEWSHSAGRLGEEFLEQAGCFTAVVEMRNDRVQDAAAFGLAIAEALFEYAKEVDLRKRNEAS